MLIIFGIVAAVGIVLMISGKGSCTGTEAEETLLAEESGDLAGMAYNVGSCTDKDAVPIIDKNQYKIKSSAFVNTKSPKTINDVCSKTSTLLEATCDSSGKLITASVDCAKEFGADYNCVDGACKSSPPSLCTSRSPGQENCKNTLPEVSNTVHEKQCVDITTSAVCEGDRIHKVIQNSCTGEKTDDYYDCYYEIDIYTGKHKTCLMAKFNSPYNLNSSVSVAPSNYATCVPSSCIFVGTNIYPCSDNGKYAKFTCQASSIPGYNYWQFDKFLDTCPDLKFDLCYDPKSKCK